MAEAPVLATRQDLLAVVDRVAAEVASALPDGATLLGVLPGAVVFLADLARRLPIPVEVDLVALTTPGPGAGRARLAKDTELDLVDRDVVVVQDIVDTGLSTAFLLDRLARRGPRAVLACALLDRPARRIVPAPLRFVGLEAPDGFVIGYGLGEGTPYRNLDCLAVADPSVLDADPLAYVAQFHGSNR